MSSTRSGAGVAPRRRRHGSLRRILLLAVAGAVAALFAAGCGDSGDDGGSAGTTGTAKDSAKSSTIGLMVIDLRNPQFADQAAQVKALAEKEGSKVVVLDAAGDATKQLQIAQDWLNTDKVDALMGSAVDINSFQPALDQAAKEGVPVVFLGFRPARGLQRAQHIVTQDFVDWGFQMGEAAGRCVDERLGGRGEAVVLDNPTIAGPIVPSFIRGIKQGLATNPGVEVVATAPGPLDRLRSFQSMQSVLQAHPGANVVVSYNEEPVLGAMRALVAAGKDPKTELCLVGSGGNPEATKALESGDFYGQIDIQLPLVYSEALKASWALIENPDDPKYSMTEIPTRVVMTYHDDQG